MRVKALTTSFLNEWIESEKDFVSSLYLPKLPSDNFESARTIVSYLYPDLDIKRKYYSNFLFTTSLTTQIPFSSYMIVDVRPYENKEEFQRYYGVSISEFVHLIKEGYLYPQFGSDYWRYKGKDYLAPVFSACHNPPSNQRIDFIFSELYPGYTGHYKEIRQKIKPVLLASWNTSGSDLTSYYMNDFDAFTMTWSKRIARVYAISPILGKMLLAYRRRKDFLHLVNIFTSIFVFPITKALGGAYKISRSNYDAILSSLLRTAIKNKRIMPFSEDIAEPLCEAIEAYLPSSIGIKQLARYLDDDLVEEANKLMMEIEEQIRQQALPSRSRVVALRTVWNETIKMINTNEKRAAYIKKGIHIGLAGLIGATLWSKLDFTALLYGVVVREILKSEINAVSEEAAARVVKMLSGRFQPRHVWMFMDYLDNIKNVTPKVYLS